MAHDCVVSFRPEEEIAEVAAKLRKRLRISESDPINVVNVVEILIGKVFATKGALELEVFDDVRTFGCAYVTFDPLTMHIEDETWHHAKLGDEVSRYIIAHEIGHAALHDVTAKKFSSKLNRFHIFGTEEQSAEWQANTFADYLLVPNEMAASFADAQELALYAGIPISRALERLGSVMRRKPEKVSSSLYLGDSCVNCGNFGIINQGLDIRCDFCHHAYGR